jgi:hypothetical protein
LTEVVSVDVFDELVLVGEVEVAVGPLAGEHVVGGEEHGVEVLLMVVGMRRREGKVVHVGRREGGVVSLHRRRARRGVGRVRVRLRTTTAAVELQYTLRQCAVEVE